MLDADAHRARADHNDRLGQADCLGQSDCLGQRRASSTTPTAPAPPTNAGTAFTVTGDNPVTPNGSQDTDAATPGATCDSAQLKADQSLGAGIADGFSLEGFPAASGLLAHFLTGSGTEIDYGLGSTISQLAQASAASRP